MCERGRSQVESHPERRFKAALETYKEAEMPQIRRDFPGLRLQQNNDRLYKDFQKRPFKPFDQISFTLGTCGAETVL